MIKVTTKEGVTFEADNDKEAYYAYFGATIEREQIQLEIKLDEINSEEITAKQIINRPKGNKKRKK